MHYAIVIEKTDSDYSAYVPDLPGCVASGDTLAEAEAALHEAIELHIAGLRENGLPLPEPFSKVDYVEIGALTASPTPALS